MHFSNDPPSSNKPSYEALEQEIRELRHAHDAMEQELQELRHVVLKYAESHDELMGSKAETQEVLSQMKSIFRSAPTGIGVVCDRKLIRVNQRLEEMLGYTKKDLIGNSARMLYASDEEFQKVGREKYRQIDLYRTGTVETKWRRKDGAVIDVLLRSTSIDFEDPGKSVTFTALDITENKQKEIALMESEARYRSMMEALNDPVYICSKNFKIEYMNPAMLKWIGRDAVGESCYKTIFNHNDICPLCYHSKVMAGKTIQHEVNFSSSHRIYHVSSSPVFHVDGSISKMAIFREITELKSITTQLQQAQKMEAIGTLAGGIAHDFNNILFPIMGHTELLLGEIPDESPMKFSLNEIYTASNRAKALVHQILAFSRQGSGEVMLIQMQTIIKEALKLLRSSIPTTIDMVTKISGTCRPVTADPTQIHQIIMNLCTNAYHAMEETGGKMIISLEEIALDQNTAFDIDSEMKSGEYAYLMVSDTGIGIPKSILERIFEPFFTTKGEGKGTGMGLATVHGIVKRVGGGIQVESTPGQGTSFHLYFPIVSIQGDIMAGGVRNKALLHKGNGHILLIDDEQPVLNMEKRMLEKLGYQVTVRSSSLDALEMLKSRGDLFDLVITDMTMPGMSGDKLAVEIKRLFPKMPIVLCTGFSHIMSEDEAERLGIDGFLMKPIVMSDFSKTVQDVLKMN